MKNENSASSSSSARAKVQRAINQLENVEVLLRSLPKRVLKKKRSKIDHLIQEVEEITEKTKTELADEL